MGVLPGQGSCETFSHCAAIGIDVKWAYIQFDGGGNEAVVLPPATTNTLKITVEGPGNEQVFLLGQSRTAGGQPKIYY